MVSHDAVQAALAAHSTAGEDQATMVRDVCQGGTGVALVVGRAGTGKIFALGIARHAWQLDGYRLLASAPTGIATLSWRRSTPAAGSAPSGSASGPAS